MGTNGSNIKINDDANSSSDNYDEGGENSDDYGCDAMLDAMAYSLSHVVEHFKKHIYKEPYMTSYVTTEKRLNELLYGHEKRCFNMFRMNQRTFRLLCMDLKN